MYCADECRLKLTYSVKGNDVKSGHDVILRIFQPSAGADPEATFEGGGGQNSLQHASPEIF